MQYQSRKKGFHLHVVRAAILLKRSVPFRRRMMRLLTGLGLCIVLTAVSALLFSAEAGADVTLTAREKNWLEQNPDKLVLWFNTDFPPIEFVSETGRFKGMGADIIALVERQLGVTFIKRASNDWNEHLAALESGECAVAPTIVATAGRERYARFTAPYASSPVVIITANTGRDGLSLSDLGGQRVAVVSGYATEGYLREHASQSIEVVPMPDVVHALRATSFGQVDAYVENLAVAAYYIQKEGIPNLRVAGDTPYSFSWSIGVSRRYPLLAGAVVKALSAIPAEELEATHKRWISLKIDAGWSSGTVHLLVSVTVFVVLLAMGLVIISYVLRRRLREKMASLESAHVKISEQAEFLQLATEVTQAGLWDSRLSEGVIFFSRQWFNMLGYDREGEEMSYGRIKAFIHPDDHPFVQKGFADYAASDGRMFYEVEFRLKQADGNWCWVLSKGRAAAWDERGAVTRIIGLDVNIQTIKDAQEEMKQSEAKFRAIFDNAPYAIVINDLESRKVVDANPTFLNSYGLKSREELLQIPSTGFSTMGSDEAQRFVDRLVESGKISNYETETVRRDGSRRHILFSSALMECAGRTQIISIILDNTERKKAEDALKLSEERFRQLFMSAPVPLVLLSLDGAISAVNNALIHTFGYTLEDVPDLDHWWPLAYPDPAYRQQVKSTWENDVRHALADNVPVKAHEYHVTCKNGKILRVRFDTNVLGEMIIVSLYEITELREKEAALQETMEQLRATLDATNDGILVVDKNLEVIQANRQFYEMWRIPGDLPDIDKDVALREFAKDQLQDPDGFMRLIEELYASNRHEMYELRFKDERVFECYSASMVIAGEEAGRVWDFRDITERKKAEEAIDVERKKLRSIFGAMNDMVLIFDARGRLVEIAPTKTDLLYRPTNEILGKTLEDIFSPEKADLFMEAIGRTLNRNEPVRLDYELTVSDRSFWFAATLSPMPPDRVVWVARDITGRKQAEAQLRQSEEKFSKIFDMAPSIVAISRLEDGHLIDINIGFEEITGWKKSEAIGRTAAEINFWAEPTYRADMVKELKAGRDLLNREVYFRRKDGTRRNGLYSARSIRLSGELSILSVVQDITEIKQIEADRQKLQHQLSQAQKMEAVGTLAGGVAHDFNNILGAIIGHTELALLKMDDANPLRETFSIILDAAMRSANLTRQLLAFARKEVIEPVFFDINTSIKELLKMMQRLIGENIELRWHPGQGPLNVKLDPSQLDQILANLCVNARDAIADIGCITIETDSKVFDEDACSFHTECVPGEYVMLSVSDNGCGMDSDTLNRIFEPFFTTKAQGKGTGLGLSTVYGIVRQNNGFIKVYSEMEKGTAFNVYFPLKSGRADEKRPACKKIAYSKGETILLVEDDAILLEMSASMLNCMGYEVLAADTPTRALRLARERPGEIHMFLTDVVMPEMSGRELAEKIEKIRPGIRHLFMSGYTADVIAHQGVLDEGVNFIHKPFSLRSLADKIRSVLDR